MKKIKNLQFFQIIRNLIQKMFPTDFSSQVDKSEPKPEDFNQSKTVFLKNFVKKYFND